jgi:AraC-like DNA-binding protein
MSLIPLAISIRSYGSAGDPQTHDFAQLVLPLQGSIDIELEGRGARLDRTRAAYVPAGVRHDQVGARPNRFLIVDLPAAELDSTFGQAPFLNVGQAAVHLIDYMATSQPTYTSRDALWTPLLIDALTNQPHQPAGRLDLLLGELMAATSHGWTVAEMAARAQLSVSRLHAVFQEDLNTTPRAWLAERRLEKVRNLLSSTKLSIAEIAYQTGFSDQSALTRAFSKAYRKTPAAYRNQESRPKARRSTD